MGLKGIIPLLLHHALLGYNFLIPDAVGNTIVTFLTSKCVIQYFAFCPRMRNIELKFFDSFPLKESKQSFQFCRQKKIV